jgi:uncharacterized protein
MRKLLAGSLAAAALTLSFVGAPTWAADPTVDQIYQAERSGHVAEAQQMMEQVLRDHPESGKAHYVQAELFAHQNQIARARAELARAEQLSPGLPKENPQSVQELKSQLGLTPREGRPLGMSPAPSASHFPWGTVLILALVVGVFWVIFRRRRNNTYVQYPSGPAPMGGPGAYGPGGPVGYGPGGGVMGGGGGIGSNIAGGLAGGLAAGAGIVAGEELAHHFLDGGQRTAVPAPAEDWNNANPANSDMGGSDFGVNDPGSWDDSSGGGNSDGGGGGGGGDDWT